MFGQEQMLLWNWNVIIMISDRTININIWFEQYDYRTISHYNFQINVIFSCKVKFIKLYNGKRKIYVLIYSNEKFIQFFIIKKNFLISGDTRAFAVTHYKYNEANTSEQILDKLIKFPWNKREWVVSEKRQPVASYISCCQLWLTSLFWFFEFLHLKCITIAP